MKITKFVIASVLALAFSAHAELAGMKDNASSEEKSEGIKAMFGMNGGTAMLGDEGIIYMGLRIGLDFKPLLSAGLWASTSVEDVRNHQTDVKEMLNYKTFGAFVELFPVRINDFSVSVPVQIGGGVINALESGDEAFEASDYFFTGDMAVHFNYRLTKMLEVSVGGGYRMVAGIEENDLENMDLCTPFGELRFTIRE